MSASLFLVAVVGPLLAGVVVLGATAQAVLVQRRIRRRRFLRFAEDLRCEATRLAPLLLEYPDAMVQELWGDEPTPQGAVVGATLLAGFDAAAAGGPRGRLLVTTQGLAFDAPGAQSWSQTWRSVADWRALHPNRVEVHTTSGERTVFSLRLRDAATHPATVEALMMVAQRAALEPVRRAGPRR